MSEKKDAGMPRRLEQIVNTFFIFLDKFRMVNGLVGKSAREGRFYVLYDDGGKSQPLDYQTAKDYASMFNGKVKHVRTDREC